SSSVIELKTRPDLYNGVFTKFGWVLVKKTHVVRGWTQLQLNQVLEEKLGEPLDQHDWDTVQQYADEWVRTANANQVPKLKRRTMADKSREEDMKLYLQQLRYDETEEISADDEKRRKRRLDGTKEIKQHKEINKNAVSFTNAWNYYMAVTYKTHENLSPKERRVKVGTDWRQMSMDQKEVYRQDYTRLLNLGKDVLHGEIVDQEVKLKATQKLWEAKERARLRKLGVLSPANK
ncbi:hypothetical protein METBIDRAFT_22916, partial [Metschnikowia bicuspidata var. bicuspidata NRRL YB-4993]